MKPVQLLSCDLDDTLLDNSRSLEVIHTTCKKLASVTRLDANQLFAANGQVWQSYWPEVEDKWTLGAISGSAVSEEAWRRTLLACGSNDESLVRLARETHSQAQAQTLRLFDDVLELFKLLKPTMHLALITNGASDTQRGRLRILGIEQVFNAVVISGEVGVAKPNPSIFTQTLDKLKVKPENAWHVGDSLRTDVAGALGAGLTAIWLNRGKAPRQDNDPKPDHEIHSLRELASLL